MNISTYATNISAAPDGSNILPNATDDTSHFSRHNLIGMFLTPQLCQLTQPYGSLLFRGVGGFFWRCNPIASLTEAIIIFWYLARALVESFLSARGSLPDQSSQLSEREWHGSTSWAKNKSSIRTIACSVMQNLHETAAVLLLLRGATGREDINTLMEKLTNVNLVDQDTLQQHGNDQRTQIPIVSAISIARQENAEAEGNPKPISRQPTLEANQRPLNHEPPHGSLQSERHRLLRKAFGANALSHCELRIDLITVVAELLILIKLLAVSGVGWFTAAAMFLIIGWVAVATLLVLLHLQEAVDMGSAAAIRITRELDAEFREARGWWTSLFIALHLPIFGYLAKLACWPPAKPGEDTFTAALMIMFGLSMILFLAYAIYRLIINVINARKYLQFLGILMIVVFEVWLLVAWNSAADHYSNFYQADRNEKPCNGTSWFEPNTTWYYVVDMGWPYFSSAVGLLCLTGLMLVAYYLAFYAIESSNERDSIHRKRMSAGNFIVTAVTFVIYIVSYDESTTSKPEWVELLG